MASRSSWQVYDITYLIFITSKTREGSNYSDILPLKAARRDSISNVTYFRASNLSRTHAVLLRVAVGRHVNAD